MRSLENAYGLVIGIADYQYINKLPPTVRNDAQDIYDLLIDPAHCGYPPSNVHFLRDGRATKAAISQAFDALATHGTPESTVFIYISSHGGRIESGPHAGEYILPVDTVYTSSESMVETAISGDELTQALRAIPARKVVVVFDCCHAGGIGQPKDVLAVTLKTGFSDDYYEALKSGIGRAILASSRSTEYSYVMPGAENSLFTQHLLAGLRGSIASEDGLIRIFDLFEYVQPLVTGDQPNQHPIFKAELEENFPVALYLGGQEKAVATRVERDFRYDAYVSYVDREPDTTWVWDTLVPRLEEAGLKIAVSGDVEDPGVARVVNIERGLRLSKRAIIVLSPTYLEDAIADFEAVLAQTMGLQEGTYRLLPVRIASIDNTQLPTRLSMLTAINLTHPRRAEREFSRLVNALQGPLPRR